MRSLKSWEIWLEYMRPQPIAFWSVSASCETVLGRMGLYRGSGIWYLVAVPACDNPEQWRWPQVAEFWFDQMVL
jgi:hypothetical protein